MGRLVIIASGLGQRKIGNWYVNKSSNWTAYLWLSIIFTVTIFVGCHFYAEYLQLHN